MQAVSTRPTVSFGVMASPLGPLGLVTGERGLIRVEFHADRDTLKRKLHAEGMDALYLPGRLKDVGVLLGEYFKGHRVEWDLPLDLQGTPFQLKVWRTLARIPYGEVRSYDWLARKVGIPGGSRAVGQANGRNPVPIIIPCHRVIRKSGELGGYGGGLKIKRALLQLEGALAAEAFSNEQL